MAQVKFALIPLPPSLLCNLALQGGQIRQLLLFALLSTYTVVFAQKKKVVVTYAADQIKITFFQPDFNHLIADYKFSIVNENGMPVADPYHQAGGCRSMQLDSAANNLFFCLYDGNDLKNDTTTAPWTAFYQYRLTTKKYTKLFSIPAEQYVIWTMIESRKTIIYYCHQAGAMLETSLVTQQTDTLFKLSLSAYNSQLTPNENGFTLLYAEHDSIKKTEYNFHSKTCTTQYFFGFTTFSSYRGGNLLVYDQPRNLIHFVTPDKKSTKTIAATSPRFFWKDNTHFYSTDSRAICIYNSNLQMELSYYMEHPFIMEQLSDGLLVKYRNRQFAFIPTDLNELPNELWSVHDNFIHLVAETDAIPQ